MVDVNTDDQAIFEQARRIGPPEERDAFLRAECQDDAAQHDRVRALLAAHEASKSFLEAPALGIGPTLIQQACQEHEPIGTHVGPYKLRELIGEGGFGLVYVAEQEKPIRRKVALKVIKPGMDSKEVIARFEAERQALALMDHPNIAKVIDAGTTETGRPYFVMELVRGLPITDYCDQAKLSLRERLKLFITVCQAVQHAHQKGIIHRDLKPSNVMITLHDGKPVPKVIDFGVAKALNQKLTEHTVYTQHAQILGTPLYMSPEQAELSGLDVDTRSDVYSLGVLLYELLTGHTPFDKDTLSKLGYDELRRMVREVEPPRPSARVSTLVGENRSTVATRRAIDERHHSRTLKGELDWIVMKALEKDRARRYESASSIGADVQRYLDNEPVAASPPSPQYRLRKYVLRHKSFASIVSLAALSMLAISLISVWRSVAVAGAHQRTLAALDETEEARANEAVAKQQAIRKRDEAISNLYLADMRLGFQDWQNGQVDRLQKTLNTYVPQEDAQSDLRGWEWHYLNSLCRQDAFTVNDDLGARKRVIEVGARKRVVAWSPDGQLLASSGRGAVLFLRNAETGEQLVSKQTGHKFIHNMDWSPDGKRIITSGADGDIAIWDAPLLTESYRFKVEPADEHANLNRPTCVAWSPDGTRIAASVTAKLVVLDASTGEELQEKQYPGDKFLFEIAWSPDGRFLVGGGILMGTVLLFDASTLEEIRRLKFDGRTFEMFSLDWSHDGAKLAVAFYPHSLLLLDTSTWTKVAQMKHRGAVQCVRWCPNANQLCVGTRSQRVTIWDTARQQELRTFQGHSSWVTSVEWSPDGQRVVSIDERGFMKRWDLQLTPRDQHREPTLDTPIHWSPAGDEFAVSSGGTVRVYSKTGVLLRSTTGDQMGWNSDGSYIAVHRKDENVAILDARTLEQLQSFSVRRCEAMAWSYDDNLLAIVPRCLDGRVDVWSLSEQRKVHTESLNPRTNVFTLEWSPVERKIGVSGIGGAGAISLISPDFSDKLVILKPDQRTVWSKGISWRPDGQRVACGGWNHLVQVWDVATRSPVHSLAGHTGSVNAVTWNPVDDRIASGGADEDVRLWDAETGREVVSLPCQIGEILGLTWSPDGKILTAYGTNGTQVFDASEDQSFLSEWSHADSGSSQK